MATVALLEDNALVRESTVGFLKLMGFQVVAAATSSDLVAELAASRLRPDVLLCDFKLDAETALEAVPLVLGAMHQAAPVLITTGDASPPVKHLMLLQGWRFLLKPFTPSELLLHLEELTQRHAVQTHGPP